MSSESVDRRSFVKQLTRSATTVGVAACAVHCDEAAGQAKGPASDAETDSHDVPSQEAGTTRPQTEFDLLLETIRKRYPDERWDTDALEGIRDELIANEIRSRILGRYPLNNWNEPAFVFSAYRADDSQGS